MKDFGGDSLDVALTLNCIGDVLLREGRRDQALEQHKRALDIQLKKVGEKHLNTANTYKYIGIALLKQNDDEKAEETLRKALDIMDDLPAKSSDLMDVSQHLSGALQFQGKFSEAIKIQKAVLSKLLQSHGEDYPEVAVAYAGIAGMLADQNRFDDALQMLDKSIQVCYRLKGQGPCIKGILA
ncbi:unnamed protein product, partial [Cylindrotheca closterium]